MEIDDDSKKIINEEDIARQLTEEIKELSRQWFHDEDDFKDFWDQLKRIHSKYDLHKKMKGLP